MYKIKVSSLNKIFRKSNRALLITATAKKKKNQKKINIKFKLHRRNTIHRKMQCLLLQKANKFRRKLIPTLPTSTSQKEKIINVHSRQYQSGTRNSSHTTKCSRQKLIPKAVSQSCAPKVVPKRRHRKLVRA